MISKYNMNNMPHYDSYPYGSRSFRENPMNYMNYGMSGVYPCRNVNGMNMPPVMPPMEMPEDYMSPNEPYIPFDADMPAMPYMPNGMQNGTMPMMPNMPFIPDNQIPFDPDMPALPSTPGMPGTPMDGNIYPQMPSMPGMEMPMQMNCQQLMEMMRRMNCMEMMNGEMPMPGQQPTQQPTTQQPGQQPTQQPTTQQPGQRQSSR